MAAGVDAVQAEMEMVLSVVTVEPVAAVVLAETLVVVEVAADLHSIREVTAEHRVQVAQAAKIPVEVEVVAHLLIMD